MRKILLYFILMIYTLQSSAQMALTQEGTLLSGEGLLPSPSGFLAQVSKGMMKMIHQSRGLNPSLPVSSQNLNKNIFAESMGETGNTLFFLWTIQCVEIVKIKIHEAHLNQDQIDPQELNRLILLAAGQLVNHIDVYSNILGAGSFGALFGSAFLKLADFVSSEGIKEFLLESLKVGTLTLISFTGWEFGGELLRQSILQIEDEALRNEALKINFLDLFSFTEKTSLQREALVAVTLNMFSILFLNSDLRNNWFNQVYRHRIFQGSFLTILSFMWMASRIGAAFGFKGRLVLLALGFLGAVGSNMVPESWKDTMTETMDESRLFILDQKLKNQNYVTESHFLDLQVHPLYQNPDSLFVLRKYQAIEKSLQERSEIRNDILNVYFDAFYRIFYHRIKKAQQVQENLWNPLKQGFLIGSLGGGALGGSQLPNEEFLKTLSEKLQNSDKIPIPNDQKALFKNSLHPYAREELSSMESLEKESFQKLERIAREISRLYSKELLTLHKFEKEARAYPKLKEALEDEKENIKILYTYVGLLLSSLYSPTRKYFDISSEEKDPQLEIFAPLLLDRIYFNTFDEANLLSFLKDSSSSH